MNFAVNVPINGTSLGQLSLCILREIKNLNLNPSIFPIGGVSDLSSLDIKEDAEFSIWIEENTIKGKLEHDRRNSSIKVWHLNGSYESVSNRQLLFSFYELDSPTETELNVARNNVTIFSSNFTCDLFKSRGVECNFIPLGFDYSNFKKVDRQYFEDDRIVFNLCGKFEKRKHHARIINSWVRKYGNNKNYYLQCALYNHFLDEATNNKLVHEATEGKRFFNLQVLRYMPKNSIYNDFLNSGDICIGMSGGEGWDLPCFHSVALGKHAVVMNEHVYKDWANAKNSVLVSPNGKTPAADGVFFHNDEYYNNGQIFDFNEDDFLEGCENAIKRVKNNRINKEGIKLQKKFQMKDTTEKILELL